MALKVTQIRSAIGTKPKQRGTLRALGLGKIGKTHILPDKPEIRGMINTVPHLIEVEEISSFTSFIMVASGTSSRHIQSIADKVIENLKDKKIEILGTEGTESKDWILIDAGEVIINIMSEDSREHYDLESLWDRKAK